jgi:hypothetical protein
MRRTSRSQGGRRRRCVESTVRGVPIEPGRGWSATPRPARARAAAALKVCASSRWSPWLAAAPSLNVAVRESWRRIGWLRDAAGHQRVPGEAFSLSAPRAACVARRPRTPGPRCRSCSSRHQSTSTTSTTDQRRGDALVPTARAVRRRRVTATRAAVHATAGQPRLPARLTAHTEQVLVPGIAAGPDTEPATPPPPVTGGSSTSPTIRHCGSATGSRRGPHTRSSFAVAPAGRSCSAPAEARFLAGWPGPCEADRDALDLVHEPVRRALVVNGTRSAARSPASEP